MNCTVASLTLPSLTSDERQRLLADESLRSLLAVFATIVDPRSKQGHRYDLPYLLTCLVAALLCNCDSTLAMGQWCRDQRDLLEQLFGPRRFLCPSDSLYRRLLPCLSAEQLEWANADWVRATLQAAPDEPIALDGKTIRGAKQDGHSGPHLLSFCTHQSQEILLQMRVGDKTNEIPVAHLLLPLYWLLGTSIPKKDGFGLPSFVFWVTFLERMYEVANTGLQMSLCRIASVGQALATTDFPLLVRSVS